ncbi:MAG: VOC family protein [Actinoplanes sp.]
MAPTFNALSIVVGDMGKALAFYRRLGLDLPTAADSEPHAEVTVGGTRLMWDTYDTIRSFDPGFTPPSGSQGIALAFECADPAEVDNTYADLVQAGYESHKEPWDAFWGQRYAVMRDPDGNTVDLYAALPQ